jgi:hypothetical protein
MVYTRTLKESQKWTHMDVFNKCIINKYYEEINEEINETMAFTMALFL